MPCHAVVLTQIWKIIKPVSINKMHVKRPQGTKHNGGSLDFNAPWQMRIWLADICQLLQ